MRTSVEIYMRVLRVAHGLYTSMLRSKVAQHDDHGLSTSVMVLPNLVYEPHDMRIGLLHAENIGIFCKRPSLTNHISELADTSLLSTEGHNNSYIRR